MSINEEKKAILRIVDQKINDKLRDLCNDIKSKENVGKEYSEQTEIKKLIKKWNKADKTKKEIKEKFKNDGFEDIRELWERPKNLVLFFSMNLNHKKEWEDKFKEHEKKRKELKDKLEFFRERLPLKLSDNEGTLEQTLETLLNQLNEIN